MTLQEYIDKNPVKYENDRNDQRPFTIWQLHNCLYTIGFKGKMGYKERRTLKDYLTTIGLPEKEITKLWRKALKHPDYQGA